MLLAQLWRRWCSLVEGCHRKSTTWLGFNSVAFHARVQRQRVTHIFQTTSQQAGPERPVERCCWRSYGGAGAVWDIWPRDGREALARYLLRHAEEFRAEGRAIKPCDILHPIHDQVPSSPLRICSDLS